MGDSLTQTVFALPADAAGERALSSRPRSSPATTAHVPGVAEVYEAHVDYVHRCLLHLGVPNDALEDAVQDVFLVVHDKLADFDGRAKLTTWLYAIVLRIARRYRAQRRHACLEDDTRGQDCTHESAEVQERLALARRALAALDADKREVLVLADIEQMSAPEVAAITGLPVGTVYSRLRAARALFSQHVARAGRSPRRRSL